VVKERLLVKFQMRRLKVEARVVEPSTVIDTAMWCGGLAMEDHDAITRDGRQVGINVPTLAGVVRAIEGSYVVRNENGHFEVMSSEEFNTIFEEI